MNFWISVEKSSLSLCREYAQARHWRRVQRDPVAQPCPGVSLIVREAHQPLDWQEQELSLQEFIIPGYSRIVCTSPSLRQVRTFGRRRLKDKSSRPWVPSLFFFFFKLETCILIWWLEFLVMCLYYMQKVFISQEEF